MGLRQKLNILNPIIAKIIQNIPNGCCFDAHMIIGVLYYHYNAEYIQQGAIVGGDVRNYHSAISSEIESFTGIENVGYENLIERVQKNGQELKSFSLRFDKTLHRSSLWRKL